MHALSLVVLLTASAYATPETDEAAEAAAAEAAAEAEVGSEGAESSDDARIRALEAQVAELRAQLVEEADDQYERVLLIQAQQAPPEAAPELEPGTDIGSWGCTASDSTVCNAFFSAWPQDGRSWHVHHGNLVYEGQRWAIPNFWLTIDGDRCDPANHEVLADLTINGFVPSDKLGEVASKVMSQCGGLAESSPEAKAE